MLDDKQLTNSMQAAKLSDDLAEAQGVSLVQSLGISLQAGFLGMANNATQLSNLFKPEGQEDELINVGAAVEQSYGAVGASNYAAHELGYNLAGDVITSFIPMAGSMKFLKLAKAGKLGSSAKSIASPFGWQAKAENAASELADIYKVTGSAANSSAQRWKVFKYTTAQQAWEGAVTSAAIEVSQNLGEVLNHEGMTATEKVMTLGTSVMLGAGIQGAFGGVFGGRALMGEANRVGAQVFKEQEAKYLYTSPIRGRPSVTGNDAADTLFHWERIERMPATTDVEKAAKAANIDLARLDFNNTLNKLFPEGETAATINPVRDTMLKWSATSEGRMQAAHTLGQLNKITALKESTFSVNGALQQLMAKAPKVEFVDEQTFSKLATSGSKRYAMDGDVMKINQGAEMTLLDSREALGHYAAARSAASKMDRPKYEAQLDRFKLVHGVTAPDEYDLLKAAYAARAEDPVKFAKDFSSLDSHFKSVGLGVADAIYAPKNVVYMDTVQGAVVESPLVHMGDVSKLTYVKPLGVVGWVDSAGVPKTYNRTTAAAIGEETDLLAYQAKRVIIADQPNIGHFNLDDLKPHDAIALEAKVHSAPITQVNGEDVYKISGKTYPVAKVQEKIAASKAAEFERIYQANPSLSAENIANSLGITENFIIARGRIGKYTTSLGTSGEVTAVDFMQPAARLLERRTYAMEYSQNANRAVIDNADIFSHLESKYAEDLAKLRANVDEGIFEGAWSKHMPDELGVEAAIGYGSRRFYRNVAQDGDYNGMIAKAGRIGNEILRRVDSLYTTRIQPKISTAASVLLKDPSARAEFAAVSEWYYQQEAKFVFLDAKTLIDEDMMVAYNRAAEQGASKDEILRGLTHGKEFLRIENDATAAYLKTVNELNKTEVSGKKKLLMNLMGKDTAINPNGFYLPPRNYPFMTFIVENANSPMHQQAHKVYRITATTEAELKAKVNDAILHAKSTGVDWTEHTSSNIRDYETARLAFEWEGETLSKGFSNSNLPRTGQVAAITPEADAAQLIVEHAEWFKRQLTSVHRAGAQMYYADDFSKMSSMIRKANQATDVDLRNAADIKVKYGTGTARYNKPSDIEQVMTTALGGDNGGFSFWKNTNNFIEDWAAKIATAANGAFFKLKQNKSLASWQEEGARVEEQLKKMGIGVPLGNYVAERLARETTVSAQDIRKGVSILHGIQSTLTLRLDAAEAFMNVMGGIVKVGGEIQYLKQAAAAAGRNAELDSEITTLFGAGGKSINFMSSMKAFSSSLGRYWSKEASDDLARWQDMGLAVDDSKVIRDGINELSFDPSKIRNAADMDSKWAKTAEIGSKIVDKLASPSHHSAMMVQYAALSIAERLGNAAGMNQKQLYQFMYSFNRRTSAITNPIQKPRLFQGAVGSVISLYQSYTFHMLNNMFRYSDKGIHSASAMVAALNTSFFGAQSMPAFNAINEHIAGRTKGHADLYTAAATALGSDINSRDAFDYVMYGAASALLQGGFYTRGSMQPRSITLIPTSFQDVPTISMFSKVINSAMETTAQLSYGAPVVPTILNGIIDVGMNRPLKGIRDVVTGKSVDGNYNNVILHDDVMSLGTVVRTMGLKPLNQAQVGDYQARILAWKAEDTKRKVRLGEEIRRVYDTDPTALEDSGHLDRWQSMYMKAGGRSSQFQTFLEDQLFKADNDLSVRIEKMLKTNPAAREGFNSILGI